MNNDLLPFIRRLPKAELHIHLVGALPIGLISDLAIRDGTELSRNLVRTLKKGRYCDVDHFGQTYQAVNRLLRTQRDFVCSVVSVAQNLAQQNVRYAEIAVTPMNHIWSGVKSDDLIAGLEAGRLRAQLETGVMIRWCMAATGRGSVMDAHRALDIALDLGLDSVVGFGIGGPEVPRAPFKSVFKRARALGLHIAPHAGERCGPEQVWSALLDLGAERIGHGIRSIEDPKLVDYLRRHEVPLEVCPTSNLATGLVPSIRDHPVARLMHEGLIITLNSDDPTLFGTDLSSEYYAVANAFQLDRPALVSLARNAIRSAFVDQSSKNELELELDSVAGHIT
jgi:aminodeoxyfutalosine deaminase